MESRETSSDPVKLQDSGKFKYEEPVNNEPVKADVDIECIYCKMVFASDRMLYEHMAIHSETGTFKCLFPGCNALFIEAVQLINHQNSHSEESAYLNSAEKANESQAQQPKYSWELPFKTLPPIDFNKINKSFIIPTFHFR